MIYFSCEFFVNGVEWLGHQFSMSKNATGTLLAAFGTALPESVVTFIAVVFGHSAIQKDIGVGAAIGGPLVLATLAYAVVGLTFVVARKKHKRRFLSEVTERRLQFDQLAFISIFIFKILLGLFAFAWKPWLGGLFFLAYAFYVCREIKGEDDPEHPDFLEPLKIRTHDNNPTRIWALLQAGFAFLTIFIASQVFVHELGIIGVWWKIPSQTVALFLSPIATELPEIMNAVIWVRQGKQILALANISGAMMIQATIPSGLGVIFTPWIFNNILIWAALITVLSISCLYFQLRKGTLSALQLSYFAIFYLVFAVGACFVRSF